MKGRSKVNLTTKNHERRDLLFFFLFNTAMNYCTQKKRNTDTIVSLVATGKDVLTIFAKDPRHLVFSLSPFYYSLSLLPLLLRTSRWLECTMHKNWHSVARSRSLLYNQYASLSTVVHDKRTAAGPWLDLRATKSCTDRPESRSLVENKRAIQCLHNRECQEHKKICGGFYFYLLFFYLLFFGVSGYIFNRVLRRGIAEVLEVMVVLSEVLIVMWWCSGAHRCERWCSVWCGQHSNQSMRVPPPCETLAIALFFLCRAPRKLSHRSPDERERGPLLVLSASISISALTLLHHLPLFFSLSLSALALSALSLPKPFFFVSILLLRLYRIT